MINIRKRGNVYQYQFEIAKVDGKRKYINKSGFKTKNEALMAGIKAYDEYINGDGVCIIEWANLIDDILPDEYLYIELKYKDMSREIILNPVGEKYEKIVEELTK